MLILMTGLPGAGKSMLARTLAPILKADILDRDEIRNRIFPAPDIDYSDQQNELASQVTYQVAEYILQRNPDRILILDGRPFSKRSQIEVVQILAQRVKQTLKIIYCWAPDEVVRQRLEQDLAETGNVAADRTMEKYLRIKATFEDILVDHLAVDTSQPISIVVHQVLDYLDIP
ncbi:MAG: ATP-binding protein [Anaerolineae bacterium]